MSNTSVIEGNKLIAEFMGAKWLFQDDAIYHRYGWFYELDNTPTKWTSLWHDNEHLQYHSSWDWLMPVVEKINALQVPEDSRGVVTYVVTIEPGYCVISAGGEGIVSEEQAFDSGEPLIATVYRAVINFIKQHNSQKEVHHG